MTMTSVQSDFSNAIARITLNRPEVRNAFNAEVISDLDQAFSAAGDMAAVRAIVLSGAGKNFSAGADLAWMKTAAQNGQDANMADAKKLASMLLTVRNCPKPVIALAHGPVMGGGCGLIACADIVIATEDSQFAFSEVKLGLTPATISPFVIEAIGPRWARRLFQTGERFSADMALQMGLVQEIVPTVEAAKDRISTLCANILTAGPEAIRYAKILVSEVTGRPFDSSLIDHSANHIAARRASAEGQEGMAAFFEKRSPSWRKKEED